MDARRARPGCRSVPPRTCPPSDQGGYVEARTAFRQRPAP